MNNQEVNKIIEEWQYANAPEVNPLNVSVLFIVSFKTDLSSEWIEFDGGRVTSLEEAERIASTDGRMWTLRKVHMGDVIISVWAMKESRDTIECIYVNEELYNLFAGKDYSHVWR